MSKKAIIIGAGIAGMSAGCYLQMNGYETEVFEAHTSPGGVCTSWKRKDYVFDGCLHWLVGSSPASSFYPIWNELVDMERMHFVDFDEYIRVEDEEGRSLCVWTDIDRLEKEMLDKAPEDEELIRDFIGGTRRLLNFEFPVDRAPETAGLFSNLKLVFGLLPYLRILKKWASVSLEEYAARCQSQLLKLAFPTMFLPEFAVVFVLFTLAWMHKKTAGYPIGGSLNFSKLIESRYLGLGGKISYRSKVQKILTEGNLANSIVLEDGSIHRADVVVSAADGHSTIYEMLEGKYVDKKTKNIYEHYEVFPSYLQVSLGLRRTFEGFPPLIYFPLAQPIMVAEKEAADVLGVRIFNFDPTLAPEGKTAVAAMFVVNDYKYWLDLRNKDRKRYISEKERIAGEVIETLEKKYGNIKAHVEVVDVSTPATLIRYTGNWKGSFEGWMLTPKIALKQVRKTLPGLANFYMAGHWVEPGGGVPAALISGRNVAQIICKKDGKRFTTTKAAEA